MRDVRVNFSISDPLVDVHMKTAHVRNKRFKSHLTNETFTYVLINMHTLLTPRRYRYRWENGCQMEIVIGQTTKENTYLCVEYESVGDFLLKIHIQYFGQSVPK